ncbi:MAG: MFS transporter [Gammaproteobacteria bacterium]|nr:MFS transporter [Gammaproteobacteria bacterium]
MFPIFRSIASLLLSYGMFLMAVGLFTTLLGIRSSLEGFSPQVTGLIMSGYFVGLLTGANFAVRFMVLGGHIRAFAVFASVMSTTALVHIMLVDPFVWFALRFLAGFCMAGLVMVTESWLNNRATPDTRGQVFSFYMITNYAASGMGQFLLPLADPESFYLFTIVSIIFSISIVPILLTQSQAPLPPKMSKVDLRTLYRLSPVGMLGATTAGFVNSGFYTLGPVYATSNAFSITRTSIFMSTAIFSGLLLQWPIGKISDRVDRRVVLIAISSMTALTCVGFILLPVKQLYVLFILTSLYGAFSFVVYSISAAHTNDFADKSFAAQTAGGLLVFFGVGAIIGPILTSQVMGFAGASGLFLSNALATLLFSLFAFSRTRIRASRPTADKFSFRVISASQPMNKELYASLNEEERARSGPTSPAGD